MSNAIEFSKENDHVGLITLNEPEKGNAMTADMVREIPDVLETIRTDNTLRVLIITGAEDYFCTGADFTTLTELSNEAADSNNDNQFDRSVLDRLYDTFLELYEIPHPTIAAINGPAVGGGLAIALLCDLRIASKTTKIGGNFPKLGIHPGLGISHFLPQEVGFQEAARMSLTGELIKGEKAEELGLVLEAVPEKDVLPESRKLAEQIAKNAPQSLKEITKTLRNLRSKDLQQTLNRESDVQAELFQTDDAIEGISAMMESREPEFTDS